MSDDGIESVIGQLAAAAEAELPVRLDASDGALIERALGLLCKKLTFDMDGADEDKVRELAMILGATQVLRNRVRTVMMAQLGGLIDRLGDEAGL